jgi:hypothetical protein
VNTETLSLSDMDSGLLECFLRQPESFEFLNFLLKLVQRDTKNQNRILRLARASPTKDGESS